MAPKIALLRSWGEASAKEMGGAGKGGWAPAPSHIRWRRTAPQGSSVPYLPFATTGSGSGWVSSIWNDTGERNSDWGMI